ncbi:FAD-binding oxidoreductase [Pseudomonas corrugata]|uniref:NAD(P)/FAD-dependent oxidoreductase n=1 Tax=Pseudomonas corrugata TaxID=47879 RepID=UPI001F2F9881|nr:FAD-binding oxidoreductase [Pseudomonas corrugata]
MEVTMQKISKFPIVDGNLGWYETSPSHGRKLGDRLKGRKKFDFAVIGAGYTGVAVAQRLAELHPHASIAIVDALCVGQGTSGRNAGFVIDVPHNLDAGESNIEHDHKLYKLNTFAINRLRSFKDKHAIDCAWQDCGKYMSAHEQSNVAGLDHFVETLQAGGFEYKVFEGAALKKRLGTDYYRMAVYTPGNVLINPSSLIRGLAAALPESVTLFENSPVLSCEYGSPHLLNFLGGSIQAHTVIQTTSSFNEEFGHLQNRLAPIFTYASLTEPLTPEELKKYFDGVKPWGTTSAHPAGTTVRFTPDNRIFVRNSLNYERSLNSNAEGLERAWKQHRKSFDARFPFLAHKVFEYTWGGMLCMTLNHQSVFKKSAEGVYTIVGCNGVGVAKGTYLGYYMAEYISGIKSHELDFIFDNSKPSWVPPDPLKALGAGIRLKHESSNAGGDI